MSFARPLVKLNKFRVNNVSVQWLDTLSYCCSVVERNKQWGNWELVTGVTRDDREFTEPAYG